LNAYVNLATASAILRLLTVLSSKLKEVDSPATNVTFLGETTHFVASNGYSISADVSPSPSPNNVTGYWTLWDDEVITILMLKLYGVFLKTPYLNLVKDAESKLAIRPSPLIPALTKLRALS
jgi:hypothetical protein